MHSISQTPVGTQHLSVQDVKIHEVLLIYPLQLMLNINDSLHAPTAPIGKPGCYTMKLWLPSCPSKLGSIDFQKLCGSGTFSAGLLWPSGLAICDHESFPKLWSASTNPVI